MSDVPLPQKHLVKSILCTMLLLASFFAGSPLSATVKPTLESLVSSSDIVLVGIILQVEQSGPDSRVVTVDPLEVLKGKLDTPGEEFSFRYTHSGKGSIDFPTLWQVEAFRLFFSNERLKRNLRR